MGFDVQLALFFSCLPLSTTAPHALQYFYTATSGISNVPEFISVRKVDGVDISYYDCSITRSIPKQMWMEQLGQQYWDSETNLSVMYEQLFNIDITILRRRFNQTGGVHVLQKMYGCQWDDESGATDGHEAFGYDGEDFLTLDLENMKWIAPVPQAVPTQRKLDSSESFSDERKLYFHQTCVEWLKKYLEYGSSTLGRKVPPEVCLLQKDSLSPVVCHATGFYPDRVTITWKRGGVEMQEDVDEGETLPNEDGTFQKRVVLRMSPKDRKTIKYTCEVAHQSGELIVMTLTEEEGITRGIIGGYYTAAVLLGVMVIAGCVLKKRKDHQKSLDNMREELKHYSTGYKTTDPE